MSIVEMDKFFGRKATLELLRKRVFDLKEGYRQNVAFLGDQYVGKTMILQKFISDLEDDDIIPIYLDLENKDLEYFYYKFAGSILYNFSKSKNLPLYDDIRILMENTKELIPSTIKNIKKIQYHMSQGKLAEAYDEIISLPQIFAKEANKFCVLILDEFHGLEDFAIPNSFQELGKKIMTQKRCLYVVTSSFPVVAQKILSEKLSLLFGDFEVVSVEPFDLKVSQGFIRACLKDVKMGEHLHNFLIDFTGGHPLYLQLVCDELIHLSALHKQKEVFLPLLSKAIENVLFNPWGGVSRHFDLTVNRISAGKGNQVFTTVLMALSNGKQKIKELVQNCGIKQSLATQKLNRLVEMGIVVKNGNFYYLKDKLLRSWLKYVFQKRRNTIVLDSERQRKQFVEEIARAITAFKSIFRKDLSSRVVELLYCFEDEAFSINGRRYKLPLFQEVIPSKIRKGPGEYFDVIKATTSEGEWFIVLKPENICENDINLIMAESKKMVNKPQRCVLISLSDLDENTRVKALQERMWIWNEGELNTLLSLYDKPYIVQSSLEESP